MFCEKCGKEVSEDAKFCENCGRLLAEGNCNSVGETRFEKISKTAKLIAFVSVVLAALFALVFVFLIGFSVRMKNDTTKDSMELFNIFRYLEASYEKINDEVVGVEKFVRVFIAVFTTACVSLAILSVVAFMGIAIAGFIGKLQGKENIKSEKYFLGSALCYLGCAVLFASFIKTSMETKEDLIAYGLNTVTKVGVILTIVFLVIYFIAKQIGEWKNSKGKELTTWILSLVGVVLLTSTFALFAGVCSQTFFSEEMFGSFEWMDVKVGYLQMAEYYASAYNGFSENMQILAKRFLILSSIAQACMLFVVICTVVALRNSIINSYERKATGIYSHTAVFFFSALFFIFSIFAIKDLNVMLTGEENKQIEMTTPTTIAIFVIATVAWVVAIVNTVLNKPKTGIPMLKTVIRIQGMDEWETEEKICNSFKEMPNVHSVEVSRELGEIVVVSTGLIAYAQLNLLFAECGCSLVEMKTDKV